MIKKILVPTDGSDYAMTGVEYAVDLARQYGALLHGIHIVDIKLLEGPFLRDISASLGTAPFVNYQGNIALILEERGTAALESFKQVCLKAGVPCQVSQQTGSVARSIVEKSELQDLVVMGKGGEHSDLLDGLLGSTTEAVVRRARCPVLVTQRSSAEIGRFVAAYDGSGHAKKALQIGVNIGENWGVPFDVLVVSEQRGDALVAEARSYVEAHEVSAEYELRGGDPSETIVAYAKEREADLVVMGAYGHTKVRELVVGSTTAYTINHSECPVLLTR